ncbi:MAG: glycosyltransferase, partial [Saprospiraceae bacterium]
LWGVWQEHRVVANLVGRHEIDGIISDNRYGCFHRKVRSVFLTHQLNIKVKFGSEVSGAMHPSNLPVLRGVAEKFANFFNRRFLRCFDECWVPDVAGGPGLSGELGHGMKSEMGGKLKYLGALSRMRRFEVEKKYDAIAVLSGPEPQRSYLEREIIGQAKALPYHFLIVQGKAETAEQRFIRKNIEVVSHLTSNELNEAMLASGVFIGRSGYSTVMDLAKLGLSAILVPTPGQTEQEYLAGELSRQGVCCLQMQGALDLGRALEEVRQSEPLPDSFSDEEMLRQTVASFIKRL